MSKEQIILASASPRRSELLSALGVRFEMMTTGVSELDSVSSSHPTPSDVASENARLKAQAVAALRPGRWVLGADTIVTFEGLIFGKPASTHEAKKFLQTLSGCTHEVITGCALFDPDGHEQVFHEISRVTFQVLSDATIERYLREVNVLDKAGAYALQKRGEWIIEHVEGSRTNVIGLPTETIKRVFQSCGLL